MDNYTNVIEVKNEILLNISPELNPQTHFIYTLIELQDKLINSDFCSVFETYNSYISDDCIKGGKVKNAVELLRKYIYGYSSSCDTIDVYLESLCNVKSFTVGSNQNLSIVNYPVFVYGTMKVFNDKNQFRISMNNQFSLQIVQRVSSKKINNQKIKLIFNYIDKFHFVFDDNL